MSIQYDSIEAKIKQILLANLVVPIEPNEICSNSTFLELGIDSFSFIKFVVDIENEFGFEFDEGNLDISGFTSLKSLVDYVFEKLNLNL